MCLTQRRARSLTAHQLQPCSNLMKRLMLPVRLLFLVSTAMAGAGGYLRRFADALDEQRLELITLLTLEQGKPLRTMATQEVDAAIYWIREVSKRQLKDKLLESTPDHDVWLRYKPLGVVGAITLGISRCC